MSYICQTFHHIYMCVGNYLLCMHECRKRVDRYIWNARELKGCIAKQSLLFFTPSNFIDGCSWIMLIWVIRAIPWLLTRRLDLFSYLDAKIGLLLCTCVRQCWSCKVFIYWMLSNAAWTLLQHTTHSQISSLYESFCVHRTSSVYVCLPVSKL